MGGLRLGALDPYAGGTRRTRVHILTAWHQELVAEFAARLVSLNYAPTTRSQYVGIVRRFYRVYPDVRPDQITPEHVERFLHGLGISPRSFCGRLRELSAYFRWLRDQKCLLRSNPCERVEQPRWHPRLRPAPSEVEYRRVRACCRTAEEAAMVDVLFFTGLRVGELRRLKVRDVDLQARTIRVLQGKGGKDRIVVFPEPVAAAVRRYAFQAGRLHPDAWLFTSRRRLDRSRGKQWIQQTIRRLGREAGLPYRLTPHVMRHGWVRLMKVKGVPVEVTARLAGHRSIRTTVELYGQLSEDDLKAVYDRHLPS